MFLGSALTRGSQPSENILKFNLPGPLAEIEHGHQLFCGKLPFLIILFNSLSNRIFQEVYFIFNNVSDSFTVRLQVITTL